MVVQSSAPDALVASDAQERRHPDAVTVRAGTPPPGAVTGAFAPGLRSRLALFRRSGVEQTDPQRFYTFAGEDSVAHVASYEPLAGQLVVDVGGGPGYFADAFRAAGARYLGLDADAGEMALHGRRPEPGITIQGSGLELPVPDGQPRHLLLLQRPRARAGPGAAWATRWCG